jgi:hypothetical protein
MSNKHAVIELIQQLPEDISIEGIVSALRQSYPGYVPPSQELDWSAEELTEEEWRQFVAHGLRDELKDAREDIYSESDGEPSNG